MNAAELHARAAELFLELRLLPAGERTTALAAVPEDALRAEVQSLLAHDAEEGALPESIGPYRVLQAIGRGASGHVFLAEQVEPVRRQVAVKVVPQAAVSPELALRFDMERRALETSAHPNVARILDAGRTAEGLPYLVMEYIRGEPITRWCEERGLAVAERIRLLLDVAGAIQHAHQRGVIHRDLKPANVLVSEVGGRPVPQVLDFGIAKPVDGSSPALTATGFAVGTPSYMAPEQMHGRSVDTRADVYGLGALLYEMVAGRPPLDTSGDPLEAFLRIRDEVPPTASRVRRPRAPGAFVADLDQILAKALEKDPERRYATVAALADDLRRLLRSEPVLARPPTVVYRLTRYARRHRVLVGAAAAVLVAMAVGVFGLVLGLLEAERQHKEALAQREVQREVVRFFTDVLALASPLYGGESITVRQMLEQASEQVDARFGDRPLVAGAIHRALGTTYTELSEFDRAELHLGRALRAVRGVAAGAAEEIVRSEIAAGSLLAQRERYAQAETALAAVLPRARRVLGPNDPDLYTALNDLGCALDELGRPGEAVGLVREALDGRRQLLGPTHPLVAITKLNLADVVANLGEVERSIEMLHAVLRDLESAQDMPPIVHIQANNNLAATYQDLNRDAEARPYLERALKLAADLLAPDHAAVLTLQANLAGLDADLGDPGAGTERYREIAEQRAALLGPTALSTLEARRGRWDAMREAGRYQEAVTGLEALLADMQEALGASHPLVAQTRTSLAHALIGAGRDADALPHARVAEAALLQQYGPEDHRTQSARAVLEAVSRERTVR